jgi:hypothetical protein
MNLSASAERFNEGQNLYLVSHTSEPVQGREAASRHCHVTLWTLHFIVLSFHSPRWSFGVVSVHRMQSEVSCDINNFFFLQIMLNGCIIVKLLKN